MSGLLKLLTSAALGLVLASAPVAAQDIRINPVPPHVKPQWTPVPNIPGVYWAPNLPADVFRHGGKYYFYWAGYLYRGSKPRGPWKSVAQPPAWFSEIDPALFKTLKKEAPAPPAAPAGPTGGVVPMPPAPVPSEEAAPPPKPAPAPEKEEAPAAPGQTPKVM